MRPLLALLLLCLAGFTHAVERETVCARQYGLFGWTQPSAFEAAIVKGHELNHASKLRNYDPAQTYVIIFNDHDRIHVLQLSLPRLMRAAQKAVDEYGKRWEVSNPPRCL